MAFRLELSDLPPRYRAQAEAQLAKGRKKRSDPLAEAARAAKITGKEFDSLGEYEYYIGTVAPKVARGEIVEWEAHPCFPLFPAGQYGALELRPVRYTADFRLVYADGTVEIVEIKSKFVRRMQRDYALRRRVFLEQVARPAGWKFTEIITADSKEEIDRWTELTKGGKVAMDEKQKPVCGLCQRHQKLETVDGMAFWIEWDENGRPRLCMDSTTAGGGLNVLCVQFCPICGRRCENIVEMEENHGEA